MRGWAVLIAIALAGCASGEYQQISGIRGGGKGLPVVSMRGNSEEVVPPGRGAMLGLAVRTFVPAAGGEWTEVTGVRCHVTGGIFYTADLVTPARLLIPDLGPDAPSVKAECANGSMSGTDIAAPAFAWPADRPISGLDKFRWGGGWWYGYEKSGPMRYPDLAIALVYPVQG